MDDDYHPDTGPADPEAWLELDDDERQILVHEAHSPLPPGHPAVPNLVLHTTFHAVVENQLLLDDEVGEQARATLARFTGAGVPRHDATHALAGVVAQHMFEMFRDGQEQKDAAPLIAELRALSPEGWGTEVPKRAARGPARGKRVQRGKGKKRG